MKHYQILSICSILAIMATAQAVADPPAANDRYVIHGSEVFDRKSQLTWQRCSFGRNWSDKEGCVGAIKKFTFDQAQKLGDRTWRVPSMRELESLVEYNLRDDYIRGSLNTDAFPDQDEGKLFYWTSTPYFACCGWIVNFWGGDINSGNSTFRKRSNIYAVRLVRSGVDH